MNVPRADDGSTFASKRSAFSTPPSTHWDTTNVDVSNWETQADTVCTPQFNTKATRWMRRKNRLRLKLDGISLHHPGRRPLRAHPTDSEPATHLLKTFSDLLNAQKESCQRLQRLVRDADTTKLCMC
ncbi:hypothetical protein NUW54_g307 [Trametes sanguinea]|uniref:Uncharacterized protein n=1 Tax=Trametes sanguinea TaxID=158606 RepID=A0ACC1Q9J2_9APHY|nr:hypothetical protein NUW54_g307 [Trametes sanguinea]